MLYAKKIDIYQRLIDRSAAVGVIGLGYVGLPIALAFSKLYTVIGYDINRSLISRLKSKYRQDDASLQFSADPQELAAVSLFIVSVPTPVDEVQRPDLSHLTSATTTVGTFLKRGDFVVFESSVYPGCTEGVCVPLLEKVSGLKAGIDFNVGYSPERINPADSKHSFANTQKLISANDALGLSELTKIYQSVLEADVHAIKNIKVAEAAKMLENAQRNVNIALMNELSVLYAALGIDMSEVVAAASSKWNFAYYKPGLVGGHCIPVDPLYLIECGNEAGINMPVLKVCCETNARMADYVTTSLLDLMRQRDKDPHELKALLMGFTYKENIDDIRNTLSQQIYLNLRNAGVEVDIVDNHADATQVWNNYGIRLAGSCRNNSYDIIIVAVAHQEYTLFDEDYFKTLANDKAVVADLKWLYKGQIRDLGYWSL